MKVIWSELKYWLPTNPVLKVKNMNFLVNVHEK